MSCLLFGLRVYKKPTNSKIGFDELGHVMEIQKERVFIHGMSPGKDIKVSKLDEN